MKTYPKVVAIDFDETLGLYPAGSTGKGYQVKVINNIPNPRIVKLIKNCRKIGHRVIIYTSRWWGDYNALVEWLDKYKIKVDDVICGRFKADLYICDKSTNAHHEFMERQSDLILSQSEQWGIHDTKNK